MADPKGTIGIIETPGIESFDAHMLAKIEESSDDDWRATAQSALDRQMFVLLIPAAFSRQNALGREAGPIPASAREIGDLTILPASHQVLAGRTPLSLTYQEFLLLETLTSSPIRLWPFQELLKVVWGYRSWRDAGPVRSAVKRLRRKLDEAHAGVVIESARGVGFLVTDTLAGLGSHSSTIDLRQRPAETIEAKILSQRRSTDPIGSLAVSRDLVEAVSSSRSNVASRRAMILGFPKT